MAAILFWVASLKTHDFLIFFIFYIQLFTWMEGCFVIFKVQFDFMPLELVPMNSVKLFLVLVGIFAYKDLKEKQTVDIYVYIQTSTLLKKIGFCMSTSYRACEYLQACIPWFIYEVKKGLHICITEYHNFI